MVGSKHLGGESKDANSSSDRRPLMVGSEQLLQFAYEQVSRNRRPLMIGSELALR